MEPLPFTLGSAASPVLRILQKDGKKAAIKLEQIYWAQLKDAAREAKTTVSKLVFALLDGAPQDANRTSLLRCFCLDKARRKQTTPLAGQSFDLLALVAACPSPVAIITSERKLVAFNPAFSALIKAMRETTKEQDRAIQLTFSEPLPRIQKRLIDNPNDIRVHHVGLQLGDGRPRHFASRFAIADRAKGMESLIVIYLEGR